MLSILLAAAIGLVGWRAYRSWQEGPWDLPASSKPAPIAIAGEKSAVSPRTSTSTDVIVSKNLFDPERGAGATREAEENSRSYQRVHNMVLVGTVIIGNNRTAIVQDGNSAPGQPAAAPQPIRLKLGDDVEGYRLSEIADKKVVFTKDAARVEVLLDYFRKVDVVPPRTLPGQVVTPGPRVAPRVVPNLPRRGRVPVPGNPAPES